MTVISRYYRLSDVYSEETFDETNGPYDSPHIHHFLDCLDANILYHDMKLCRFKDFFPKVNHALNA